MFLAALADATNDLSRNSEITIVIINNYELE